MTMISDLSENLVEEILSRVPITCLIAVRCTCKQWNALLSGLSKNGILCKAEARQQFLGFMINKYKMCSMRFDLHGILNEEGEEFVDPSIKEIEYSLLDKVKLSKIFHCDGLLMLSLTKEEDKTRSRRLVVLNPYLGQTKWIEPRTSYHRLDRYALGYDNKNRNHKILRFLDDHLGAGNHVFGFEIYDFSSDSWRVLDINPDWDIYFYQRGQTLKGNAYFIAKEKIGVEEIVVGPVVIDEPRDFLLCFDFTRECFGQFLPLPFYHYVDDTGTLSSLKDEKLAALYQGLNMPEVEVWVTSRIEPDAVSWIPFLKVNLEQFTGFGFPFGLGFQFNFYGGSFFIDEEKKLAVVFDLQYDYESDQIIKTRCYQTAYVIAENGNLKKVHLGEAAMNRCPLVCSYVPSLVQIQPNYTRHKEIKRETY